MTGPVPEIEKRLIYLDHGATSFPKAPGVKEAIIHFMETIGVSPGRSSHRLSIDAGRMFFKARNSIHKLFQGPSPQRVLFTSGVTESINTVLFSLLRNTGENHVITTKAEHNALMRPLEYLSKTFNLHVTRINTSASGQIDPGDITKAIQPHTRLIALLHGSNVTGVVRNLAHINESRKDIPLLLDAAQTAGVVPISLKDTPVDYLCFTGHKGLLGPQGTGGIVLGNEASLEPLYYGGTGSNSEEEIQPSMYPDKIESGTPNSIGIAGLKAAVEYINQRGIESIYTREREMSRYMYERFSGIKGLSIHGWDKNAIHLPTCSVTFDGISVSEAARRLDKDFGICVRMGLHCAPSAHKQSGTFPDGTVRFSAGPFVTTGDIDSAAVSICTILQAI